MSDVAKFYDGRIEQLKVKNLRHFKVFDSIDKLLSRNICVLDLGCGAGLTSRHLAQNDRDVVAIDISSKLIKFAADNNSHWNRVKYIVGDISKIKLNRSFDAVVAVDVFEHLEKPEKVFDLINDVSHETTKVYLNIPGPDTIRFLKDNRPETLQIIDNPVETSFIIKNFKKIGFVPAYFNFYWYQYVEYLFVKQGQFDETLKGLYG